MRRTNKPDPDARADADAEDTALGAVWNGVRMRHRTAAEAEAFEAEVRRRMKHTLGLSKPKKGTPHGEQTSTEPEADR